MSTERLLPRDAFRKAGITNVVSGSTGAVAFSIIHGMILTKFVLDLGLSREILGMVQMVVTLVVVFQFVGAYLVEKTGKKRAVFLLFGLLRWVPICFILAVPSLPSEPSFIRPAAVCLIYFLLGALGNTCAAPWNNLMNDIIPGNRRSRFWSTRSIIANISASAGVFFFSHLIEFFKDHGSRFTGYYITFAAAVVLGVIDTSIHAILPESPNPREPEKPIRFARSIWETCLGVFRHAGMRNFLVFHCILTFQANLFMIVFQVYALDSLNIPLDQMGTFTSLIFILSIAGYFLWGRIGDQFGYKIPIVFNVLMRFGLITVWFFLTPHNYLDYIWIWIVLGGLFNVGLFLNTLSTMHAVVPRHRRAHYMAFLSVVPTLAATLAGGVFYVGAPLLKGVRIHLLGLDFSDIKLFFLVIFLLNFLLLFVSTRLQTPKDTSAPRVFRGIYTPGGLRTIWNVMVTGFSIGEKEMIERTKKMGAMENPIAVDKLVQGLEDPSFRVRQESAWALGRIREEEAREALERVLNNPDSMIHDEAVWSLGKIGNEESLRALIPLLETEDAGFRARIVLALGDIRSRKAVEPLMKLLEKEKNRFVRECIFDSLAILRETRLLPLLVRTLARESSYLSRRHMAMSIGVYIDGKKDEFYKLLAGEIEDRGSMGNTLSARIRSAMKKNSFDRFLAAADELGDLFWEERYGEVVCKVVELYDALRVRLTGDSPAARLAAVVLENLREAGGNEMESAAIAMYSLLKFLQRRP